MASGKPLDATGKRPGSAADSATGKIPLSIFPVYQAKPAEWAVKEYLEDERPKRWRTIASFKEHSQAHRFVEDLGMGGAARERARRKAEGSASAPDAIGATREQGAKETERCAGT